MTSLSFQSSDKEWVRGEMERILCRRRAMVPWPLAVDDMVDVQYLPRMAAVVRDLRDNYPDSLYWDKSALLSVDTEKGVLYVKLVSKVDLPLNCAKAKSLPRGAPIVGLKMVYTADTEATERLRHWAWAAHIIELENRWAAHIIAQVLENTTTHQQVHRYMPEIYTLMDDQYRRGNKRLRSFRMMAVIEELHKVGSTRASKTTIDEISLMDRNNLKILLAQTLLLQPQMGLGEGTIFEDTWIAI